MVFFDFSTDHDLYERSPGVGNCLRDCNKRFSMIFELVAMVIALAFQSGRLLRDFSLLLNLVLQIRSTRWWCAHRYYKAPH